MSSFRFAFIVSLGLLVSACGSNSNPNPIGPTPVPSPAPAPSPSPSPAPTPNPGSTTVTIGTNAAVQGASAFGTNPLTVAAGTTVVWRNDDTIPHTATSDAAGVFNTGNINPGGTASMSFTTAGTVRYHCAIHPGMMGTLVVQ